MTPACKIVAKIITALPSEANHLEFSIISLLTPDIKSWIGHSEAPTTVEVSRRDIIKYSIATEQTRQIYLVGDEAPPMFVFGLFRPLERLDNLGPDGGIAPMGSMPELPLKRIMAGGTKMTIHRPIRSGHTLVGTRTIVDIFQKDGKQGPLIFLVLALHVTTVAREPVMEEIQTRIAR